MANIKILTSPACGRCKVTKKLLTEKGIEFDEVDVRTEEGQRLVKVYKVTMAGTLIDLSLGKVVELNEIE